MNKFEQKVEKLEDIVLEKEDYSKGKKLVMKIISKFPEVSDVDTVSSFLSSASMSLEIPEDITLYDRVTDWLMINYSSSRNLDLGNEILTWLNTKLECWGEIDCLADARLALQLFEDILKYNPTDKPDESLTNDLQGFSTYAMEIGIIDNNVTLIDKAIDAQRKVLELYQTGTFPEYYNLSNFVAGAKGALGSALLQAFKHDDSRYSSYFDEIGSLLRESAAEYQVHGTDFNKEYSQELLNEYNQLRQ